MGGVPVNADADAITDPVGQLVTTRFNELLSGDGGALAWYADWPVAGLYDVLLAQSSSLVQGPRTRRAPSTRSRLRTTRASRRTDPSVH